MKILFLSYKFYPDIGGIEVNSEILASHFQQLGAQIKLVTWSTITESEKTFPYDIYRNPGKLQLIKLHKWADVVYENNPNLKMAWPSILFNACHVIALRTWIRRMNGEISFTDKLKMNWLHRADAVIAVSEAVRQKTFSSAAVIGNPYRSSIFKRNTAIPKTKDFVFLGRLVSDKGADMAVNLIHTLINEKNQDFTLTLIGNGPEKQNLMEQVERLGISEKVFFTGILRGDRLVDELNRHRYLLAPSRWEEPFGNIALEGIACGCLPIVSDGGGLPDAAGKAGITFRRNCEEDFFKQTVALLNNPVKESKIRSQFATHLKNHEPQVVAKRYYDVILNAFNER